MNRVSTKFNESGLDNSTIKSHLSVVENGFYIEKNIIEGKPIYKLIRNGKV